MTTQREGQHTILASWAGAVVSAAGRLGVDWDTLSRSDRMADPRLSVSGSRMQQEFMSALWKRASLLTSDQAISIEAARCLQPHAVHALGFGLLAAGTLDEVCRLVQRNLPVISTAAAINIDVGARYYSLMSVCEPAVSDEGFEMFMVFLSGLFRLLSGDEMRPVGVHLRRSISSKSARDRFCESFGVDVAFEQSHNMLVFEKPPLFDPLPTSNPEIRLASERIVAQYLDEFGSAEFKTIVRSRILSLLASGRASEERVAKDLFMSCSSMSRRLRAEGTTYRALLTETQRSLAIQYLDDADLPISEIGFRLGFDDISSFSRSFRRWTSTCPREWRRRRKDAVAQPSPCLV